MDFETVLDEIVDAESEARQAWMRLTDLDASSLDPATYKRLEETLFAAQRRLPELRRRLLDISTFGRVRPALKAA
jgi:hypothetical protein